MSAGTAERGAPLIDADRLTGRLRRLAELGAVPAEEGGGIDRPGYGRAHAEAVRLVAGWMREAGLTVGLDEAGILVGIWAGSEAGAPAIALGSHLDTVPHGGAYDGALGVLAALEAVQSMAERGERLRHPLAVLAFADEEGNNFGIGVLSAQLWTGAIGPERFDRIQDRTGRSLGAYLASFQPEGVERLADRPTLAAYLEAHIEQGPVLAGRGQRAAAVTAIAGISRTTVRFVGEANHAGTTPMGMRRDALWGAAELALTVRDLGLATADKAVTTVGVFEVGPGATNVVPGMATLRIEMRSADEELLAGLRRDVTDAAEAAATRHGLELSVEPWHHASAVPMDEAVIAAVRAAMVDAGLPDLTLPSWAGHDAKAMAPRMPAGMLFVPSVGGLSHAPGEHTEAADCALAAELLYRAAARLDVALAPTAAADPSSRT